MGDGTNDALNKLFKITATLGTITLSLLVYIWQDTKHTIEKMQDKFEDANNSIIENKVKIDNLISHITEIKALSKDLALVPAEINKINSNMEEILDILRSKNAPTRKPKK